MLKQETTYHKRPDIASKAGKKSKPDAKKSAVTTAVHRLVEGTMLDYLREALTQPDKKGHKYYEDFINNFLTEAKENPNSQAAKMLGSGIFSENTLSKLDSATNKLLQRDIDFHTYRIRQTLYDKQQQVYDDTVDKEIMIMCSRRSGKTILNSRLLIKACLTPNTPCAYIHLTFSNGVRQIFDELLEVAGKCELAITRSSKSDGFIEFANGSSIQIFGNSNNSEADKARGFHYKLVIIEEVQSQRNLKYLTNDVIGPLLKDFADSQLIFTGTPPRNKNHYSRTLWANPKIKHYTWTLLDNPYIPNRDKLIQDECEKRGLTIEDPFIQREFLGNMEALDVDSQVYRGYQTYENIPAGFIPDRIYIGVDYGGVDYNAVIPLLVDSVKKTAYTYDCKKFNKASATEIANNIIQSRDNAIKKALELNKAFDLNKVQIITDTNEKSLSYELVKTYGIKNVYNAYKHDKSVAITQMAEWLRNGHIYIDKNGPLEYECENTMYKRDENDNILSEIDDDLFHPDALDALLYASRQFAFDVMRVTSGGDAKKLL